MHVWQVSSFGIDSLEFTERMTPQPSPGEVLVRVRAISFNYRDLMMVKGLYNPRMKLPRIPCSDGAGDVLAVGEGVTRWKPGDRVKTLRGSLNGVILKILGDGKIVWRPDCTKSELTALPESLLKEN